MKLQRVSEAIPAKKLPRCSASPVRTRLPQSYKLGSPLEAEVLYNQKMIIGNLAVQESVQYPDMENVEQVRKALMSLGVGGKIIFPLNELHDQNEFFLHLEAILYNVRETFNAILFNDKAMIRRVR